MDNTQEITFIDGIPYVLHKGELKNYDRLRLKRRRKKFVRIVKRVISGPIFGLLVGILVGKVLGLSVAISLVMAAVLVAGGMWLPLRYVKRMYIGVVGSLYLYLVWQIISHAV